MHLVRHIGLLSKFDLRADAHNMPEDEGQAGTNGSQTAIFREIVWWRSWNTPGQPSDNNA